MGHFTNLYSHLYNILVAHISETNKSFLDPIVPSIGEWLLGKSHNTEDFAGDNINLSKSWTSIVVPNGGYYLFSGTDLLTTFRSSDPEYIYEPNPDNPGTYIPNWSKRVYKEPYTGCWLLIKNLAIISTLTNFKMVKIGRSRIHTGEIDLYKLTPVPLKSLQDEKNLEWSLDDINRSGILCPKIIDNKIGIYLGNVKNDLPDGWGALINKDTNELVFGTWEDGKFMG